MENNITEEISNLHQAFDGLVKLDVLQSIQHVCDIHLIWTQQVRADIIPQQ